MILLKLFNYDIVFNPIISLGVMIPYSVILAVIVIINRRHIINRLLIILLVLVISQRPMLKDQEEITYNLNLDVLFVIDNTVSMHAVDVNNNMRLEAVKHDCIEIIKEFPGASFGIITFANIAQVKYPFTTESATIEDVIDRIKIVDPNYAEGSTLDLPYDYMKMLLESSNSKDKHKRVVFFIGDGELTKKDSMNTDLSKYKDLDELVNGGAVLGYGSAEGAKVKITESSILYNLVDNNGYLLNGSTNKPAISKLNEDNLKKIATNLSLDYYHMTDYSVLKSNIEKIKQDVIEDNNEDEEKMDKDIYYYFSGALIALLVIELFHYRRNEQ